MTAGIRLLHAAQRVATPWKNGGGVTREVCRDSHTSRSDSFDWRLSIAAVSQAGPFSRFPGYRRLIALIGGQGMELRSATDEIVLLRPMSVHRFDGDSEVSGALPFGPVSDLNLIFRPGAVSATMRFSSEAERWQPNAEQTVILINVQPEAQRCTAAGRSIELASLDAVIITSGASLSREAGALCAVVEIEERQRPAGAER